MGNNNSLSDDWKDTIYNIGGAIYGLGKVMCKSVKIGVDKAYDYLNDDKHDPRKPASNACDKPVKKSDKKSDEIVIDDSEDIVEIVAEEVEAAEEIVEEAAEITEE